MGSGQVRSDPLESLQGHVLKDPFFGKGGLRTNLAFQGAEGGYLDLESVKLPPIAQKKFDQTFQHVHLKKRIGHRPWDMA